MGVLGVLISCCLFIHLGLGQTICRMMRREIVILNCVKCLTFWSVLAYTLIRQDISLEWCIAEAFGCSYASLWIDLFFNKMRIRYEKEWRLLDAEEQSYGDGGTESREANYGIGGAEACGESEAQYRETREGG